MRKGAELPAGYGNARFTFRRKRSDSLRARVL